MSDKLREAIKFVRTAREKLRTNSVPVEVFFEQYSRVADAYMAEHPEDDNVEISEEWLLTLKGWRKHNEWFSTDCGTINIDTSLNSVWIRYGKFLSEATRGDVRRLARALRVELGEGK